MYFCIYSREADSTKREAQPATGRALWDTSLSLVVSRQQKLDARAG